MGAGFLRRSTWCIDLPPGTVPAVSDFLRKKKKERVKSRKILLKERKKRNDVYVILLKVKKKLADQRKTGIFSCKI